MKFTPRPYQHLAIEHLHQVPRCALYAGMGMGKTSATLNALDGLYLAGETHPTLVLAPLRVARSTWPDEAKKWDNLRHIEVQPVVGTVKEREAALRNKNASVFTANYDNLVWLIETLGSAWPFGTVVSDESTKLKGFRGGFRRHPKTGKVYYQGGGGQRARALGRIAHTKVKRFMQLTGTPSPNGLIDLWGQAWFLDAGERLGRTFEAFTSRWFQKSFDGFNLDPLPFAQEEIQDRLRDICLSINPKDWFDLRAPIVNVIKVELPRKARELYRQMEREMFMQIGEHDVEAVNAAARTVKCLQICNGAAYVGESNAEWKELHDEKINALASVVEEAAGAPVMVAYHFRSDLIRLQKAFPQGRALDADPGTIRDWNAGRVSVLFAHPASAGHGLSLQDGGNILVFFGHWWNLEEKLQIAERIGPVRQMQSGYDRPVFIHEIVAADTVDELVLARHESKRQVQDLLLAYMRKGRT